MNFAAASTTFRPLQRAHDMKFGTELTPLGVRFRFWAPECEFVRLRIEGEPDRVMQKLPRGWFELEVPAAGPGTLYRFVLPDGTAVPDPASRYQPGDVHGPSEVIDPRAFGWTDAGWRGRLWEETVLYELHLGTFTPEGTYRGAIARLDYLKQLGITAIELMPVADFPGRWNWGYDGVLHFAPDASYGRPEDLKALVDAAHARGIMVFLDVVYNHFGPDGNYMGLYAPITTDKHETPWGEAVNFDDEGSAMVREFVTNNALYWFTEYHLDGLRLDAVQSIIDSGNHHLLEDLAERVRSATDGRAAHLVMENAYNEAGWLKRRKDNTVPLFTAQWSDDIHHGLQVAVTGESDGYYADYTGRIGLLGRALSQGFGFQGEYIERREEDVGEPSDFLPPTAFVSYIQDHDQIGNRTYGSRLTEFAPLQAVRTMAAISLLSPHIPLLFMGEEWAAAQPFPYFSDADGKLADAIRTSRTEEFDPSPEAEGNDREVPDPLAEATFEAARLDWSALDTPPHAEWLATYRALLQLRHKEIIPRLAEIGGFTGHYQILGERALKVWWKLADGATLTMAMNLAPEPLAGAAKPAGRQLWLEGTASGDELGGFSVLVSLAAPDSEA